MRRKEQRQQNKWRKPGESRHGQEVDLVRVFVFLFCEVFFVRDRY